MRVSACQLMRVMRAKEAPRNEAKESAHSVKENSKNTRAAAADSEKR